MAEIKKVLQRIYEFNLKNCDLIDGNEMITTEIGSEFVNNFKKTDFDNGIIVMPLGYTKGLIYKSSNNGEYYNPPTWVPDIVKFSYNIYGLKKDAFYRVTVIGRNTRKFVRIGDVTDDRTLQVSTNLKELIIDKDFSDNMENVEVSGIFHASSTECDLFFRLGKIYINNIIIDEVELLNETTEQTEEEKNVVEITNNKQEIKALAVFNLLSTGKNNTRYEEVPRLTGKGINLYFDNTKLCYILERDNCEDTLGAAFTNIDYLVDFNFNKVVNKDIFSHYEIVEISPDISPNTLKQGYISFQLIKDGKPIKYSKDNSRLAVTITKIF